MSNTIDSPTNAPQTGQTRRRPLDGVMIALSAALLVILGIVIGRFIVTSQSVDVADHRDSQLATLRAEIVELNRQLIRAEAQGMVLQESSDRHRRLALDQQDALTRVNAGRQQIGLWSSEVVRQRQICLEELHQYVAMNQSVPATDVLRFAEDMFDAHEQTLKQLAESDHSDLSGMPSLPRFQVTRAAVRSRTPDKPAMTDAPVITPSAHPIEEVTPTLANLPLPPSASGAETAKPRLPTTSSGVFFAPPQERRQPGRYTFFAPRRNTPITSLPQPSGITFHDTAAAENESVRR